MASETTKNHHPPTYSSSSSTSPYTYDAFLSFRGKDTRKSFTDHLYIALTRSRVHTSRHDYELPIGSDRTLEMPKAIQESKVSIIVFSKGYASSCRCPDELENIMDCRDSNGHLVLPVYYNVEQDDVREQNGTFGNGFATYEENSDVDVHKVERWRAMLAQARNLSGWDLQNIANGYTLLIYSTAI